MEIFASATFKFRGLEFSNVKTILLFTPKKQSLMINKPISAVKLFVHDCSLNKSLLKSHKQKKKHEWQNVPF